MKPLLQSFSNKTEDGLQKQHNVVRFDNDLGHGRFAVLEIAHNNLQQAKFHTLGKKTNSSSELEQVVRIVDANNAPANPESKTETWVEIEKPVEYISPSTDNALEAARARVAEAQAQDETNRSQFGLAG